MLVLSRRLILSVTIALTTLLLGLVVAGSSFAASSPAYPPGTPSPSSSSSVAGVVTHHDAGSGAAQVSHTGSGSDSNLASTGFDAALASVIVMAMLGVGTLLLVAGRRRRHA